MNRSINWQEQDRLLKVLPDYLAVMVLFSLNTGLRDQELCKLKWLDECKLSGTNDFVFLITGETAKNGDERIVPLNSVARSIIQSKRGNQSDFVFDYQGRKLDRMNNKAWRKAREECNLKEVLDNTTN